jgi:hypothetical protein
MIRKALERQLDAINGDVTSRVDIAVLTLPQAFMVATFWFRM